MSKADADNLLHVFMDTNIYLLFYHLSDADLEELEKLISLIDSKRIELYLPQQVFDEFHRNREAKIFDAIRRFKGQNFKVEFPQMSKTFPEYGEIRTAMESAKSAHSRLLAKLQEASVSSQLKADKVIADIFAKARHLSLTDDILEKAVRRKQLNNPPGKNDGSYGDQLNWEILMVSVPKNRDLFLITEDGDYYSVLLESELNPYLRNEWKREKNSEVRIFRKLSDFLGEKFRDITLTDDLERDVAVERFITSGSFLTTHNAIAGLQNYADFSHEQVQAMAEAILENDQIYWIINDSDVQKLLKRIVENYRAALSEELLKKLEAKIDKQEALSVDWWEDYKPE